MSSADPPSRPPLQPGVEWPATASELVSLRDEFRSFRQGLLGSKDFPSGELQQIKSAIAVAERHRIEDVTALHKRLDEQNVTMAQLPDVVVAKINGTYVKTSAIGRIIDDRINTATGAGRLRRLAEGWKVVGTVLALLIATVISTLLLTYVFHVNHG